MLESAFEEARAVDALIDEAKKGKKKKEEEEERGRRQLLGSNGTATTTTLALPFVNSSSPSPSPSALPPLLCVPFLIKDNIDVRDTPTTAASAALLLSLSRNSSESESESERTRRSCAEGGGGAAADASVVASLRRAGAVILAKSNMAELALSPVSSISSVAALDELEREGSERRAGRSAVAAAPAAAAAAKARKRAASPPSSRHLGAVRNPFDLSRSPAGSSGGSAAGVAASLALASLGTDTGNSVRGPASAAGLVGFRPSLGLVSRRGAVPLDSTSDTVGPIARSVADAAAVLDAMVAGTAAEEEEEARRSSSSSASEQNRDFSVSWSAVPPSARRAGIHAAAAEIGSRSSLKGIRIGVLDCALVPPPPPPWDAGGEIDKDGPGGDERPPPSSRRFDVLRLFNSSMSGLEAAGATVSRGFTIRGNSLGEEEWPCLPGVWPTGSRGGAREGGGGGGAAEGGEGGGGGAGGAAEGGAGPALDSRAPEPLACRGRFAADAEPYFARSLREGGDAGKGFVRSLWESRGFHPATSAPLWSHFDDGRGGEIPASLKLLPERDPGGVCGCGALWEEEEGGEGSGGGGGGGGSGGKGSGGKGPDRCRKEFRERLVESMDFFEVDAVAFPTWTAPPRLLAEDDDFTDQEVESAVLQLLSEPGGGGGGGVKSGRRPRTLPSVAETGNLSPLLSPPTGAPAVSLPMGFTEAPENAQILLPAGLQLVGRPFGDAELVRVAAAVERAFLARAKEEEEEEEKEHRGRGRSGLLLLGHPPPLFGECGPSS